jgi:S1-C subfamily serine protease
VSRAAAVLVGVLLAGAAAVGAQEAPPGTPEVLRRKAEACAKGISERFVFFAGGSGVFISADGYALTNHHVAGTQNVTRVTLFSGEQFTAKRVCTDALGDISLFKVDGGDRSFPFVEFGDSDALEMGQYVVACGNPFGIALPAADQKMYPTITLGIVSAIHRYQPPGYFDCVQTDAAVNPGNSGGPLVTLDGRLVGINGRIATRYMNRVNSGVGYAIPSNQIRNFLPGMKKGGEGGKIFHGQVGGLQVADVNTQGQGARVSAVRPGSAAEEAGLRKGDHIVAVGPYPVFNRERFLGAIGVWPEGTTVKLKVKRAEETEEFEVRLERFSDREALISALPQRPPMSRPKGSGYLGAYVEEAKGGLKVMDVRPGSPAEESGLRSGDVIATVGSQKALQRDEFLGRLWQRKPGQKVRLGVLRDGQTLEIEVTLAKHPDDE